MFETNFVEKIRTQILCSKTFFFQKPCLLRSNVEKYVKAGRPQMT